MKKPALGGLPEHHKDNKGQVGAAIVIRYPDPAQKLYVSADLARVSALTRRPAARLRVGRHVRQWRLYLRRCA
jgi:hypothetical protein